MALQQIAAIDLGSALIRAAIARVDTSSQEMTILGWAEIPSLGIVHGHVEDLEAAQQSLQLAVEAVENAAGERMRRACVGISGSHLQSIVSAAMRPLSSSRQVKASDLEQLLHQARQIQLKEDRQVIHNLVRTWALDERIRVSNPTGMQASILGLEALVISGNSPTLGNLRRCFAVTDVEVQELVVSSLAARRLALTKEEERMGVALVNLGAGTTDLLVVQNGKIQFVGALNYGSAHFTSEMAALMHCPWEEAERIKCTHGTALPVSEPKTAIRANAFGDQGEISFSSRFLTEILAARIQKLWDDLDKLLRHAGFRNSLAAGLVLTGGGCQLSRLHDSCRTHFKLPVRRAELPRNLSVENLPDGVSVASHCVLLGLLQWAGSSSRPEKPSKSQSQTDETASTHPLRRLFALFLPGGIK